MALFTLDNLSLPIISNTLPQLVIEGYPELSLTFEDMGDAPISEESLTGTAPSTLLQVAGGYVPKLQITSVRSRTAQLQKDSPKFDAWIQQEQTLNVLQNISIVTDSSTGRSKQYSVGTFVIIQDDTGTLPYVKINFELGYDVNNNLVTGIN